MPGVETDRHIRQMRSLFEHIEELNVGMSQQVVLWNGSNRCSLKMETRKFTGEDVAMPGKDLNLKYTAGTQRNYIQINTTGENEDAVKRELLLMLKAYEKKLKGEELLESAAPWFNWANAARVPYYSNFDEHESIYSGPVIETGGLSAAVPERMAQQLQQAMAAAGGAGPTPKMKGYGKGVLPGKPGPSSLLTNEQRQILKKLVNFKPPTEEFYRAQLLTIKDGVQGTVGEEHKEARDLISGILKYFLSPPEEEGEVQDGEWLDELFEEEEW